VKSAGISNLPDPSGPLRPEEDMLGKGTQSCNREGRIPYKVRLMDYRTEKYTT